MSCVKRARRGSALLDVVIALVVLALGGTALIGVIGQTSHAIRSVRTTEREIRGAAGELDRLVIYDRSARLGMLGTRVRGPWTVTVVQATSDLFDVTVAGESRAPLLRTTMYRPDTTVGTP